MNEMKNQKISNGIKLSDSLIATVTRGSTNRRYIHVNTDNPTDVEKIDRLFEQYLNNSNDELINYITNEVKGSSNRLNTHSGIFYRGIDIANKSKIIGSKVGPPNEPKANRYNNENELALYLIDNIEFLYSEIKSNEILLQKYKIPIDEINIADISPENESIDNNLAIIFDICETGQTSKGINIENSLKNSGKSKYFISQKIAKIFKELGWDGLYIPGIHGIKNQHYHNLCIFFQALKDWEKWTIGNFEDYKLK